MKRFFVTLAALFPNQDALALSLTELYPGARAVSMGGAFAAVADDPSAVFYNAAGAAFVDDNTVTGTINSFQRVSTKYSTEQTGRVDKTYDMFGSPFVGNTKRLDSFAPKLVSIFGIASNEVTYKMDQTFRVTDSTYIESNFQMRTLSSRINAALAYPLAPDFSAAAGFSLARQNVDSTTISHLKGNTDTQNTAQLTYWHEESKRQTFGPTLSAMYKWNDAWALGVNVTLDRFPSQTGSRKFSSMQCVIKKTETGANACESFVDYSGSSELEARTVPGYQNHLRLGIAAKAFHDWLFTFDANTSTREHEKDDQAYEFHLGTRYSLDDDLRAFAGLSTQGQIKSKDNKDDDLKMSNLNTVSLGFERRDQHTDASLGTSYSLLTYETTGPGMSGKSAYSYLRVFISSSFKY